jgi:hypothetical protein
MIEYLSPSSYMQFKNQPITFYITRVLGHNRFEQSSAAALGTAFDIRIKEHLIKEKFPHRANFLKDINKALEFERDKCLKYVDENIMSMYLPEMKWDFCDVEIQKKFDFNGIPFFIKSDASVNYKGKEVPFDWKCKGLNSSASPSKAYFRAYDRISTYAPHKDYPLTIDQISERYAIQFTIYGWGMGYKLGEEFNVCFDEICKSAAGNIKVANYACLVTKNYQLQLFNDILTVWKTIQKGDWLGELTKLPASLLVFLAMEETWF